MKLFSQVWRMFFSSLRRSRCGRNGIVIFVIRPAALAFQEMLLANPIDGHPAGCSQKLVASGDMQRDAQRRAANRHTAIPNTNVILRQREVTPGSMKHDWGIRRRDSSQSDVPKRDGRTGAYFDHYLGLGIWHI